MLSIRTFITPIESMVSQHDGAITTYIHHHHHLLDECTYELLQTIKTPRNTSILTGQILPLEEQVAIFLYIVGHSSSNRATQDRFQHSGKAISRKNRKKGSTVD
ncbi:uncharacterized protein VP01_3165g2, partial [Puccinia sorghi]